MTIDNEKEWRPVIGYEDCYLISNDGILQRIKAGSGTQAGSFPKPNYLRGYIRYFLSKNSKVKSYQAHRAVYETFVGIIPEGMQINHINGIKDDNRVENLEIVTPSQNKIHSMEVLGKQPPPLPHVPGEKHGFSKLTAEDVIEIRRLYNTKQYSQQKIADMFGVCQTRISSIVLRKGWTHI